MNWEAIGAVGEIIGALAVVVSLIYLATQIRVQNSESRMAGNHAMSEGFRDSIAELSDPNLSDIFHRAMVTVDSITDQELIQMFAVSQRILRVWEEAYGLHETGRIDTSLWDAMVRQYTSFLGHAGIRHVWELRKQYYNENFRAFVDEQPSSDYRIRFSDA
jgi:hypothetical protein